MELSYGLFGDRDTLAATFIKADFLDHSAPECQALVGTVDVCHVGIVLHTFDLEGQTKACERLVDFMKRQQPGVLIVGSSVGRTMATVGDEGIGGMPNNYMHNVESFEMMWADVQRRTGTRWKASVWMHDSLGLNGEKSPWRDALRRRLVWQVRKE